MEDGRRGLSSKNALWRDDCMRGAGCARGGGSMLERSQPGLEQGAHRNTEASSEGHGLV